MRYDWHNGDQTKSLAEIGIVLGENEDNIIPWNSGCHIKLQ